MKKIKFRAWDKKNKQIAEVLAIDYLANEVMLDHFGEIYFLKFEHVELLQYTGVKDKNGTEIYEGDILKGDCTYLAAKNDENDFMINSKIVFEKGKYTCQGFDIDTIASDVDVIGNIYENPKRLEDKHAKQNRNKD